MKKSDRVNHLWHYSLLLALLLALLLTIGLAPATPLYAKSVPAACLTDSGQPIRPNPAYLDPGWTSAWTLILNFNHAPSTIATVGCLATITQANPGDVDYTLVSCPLLNNAAGVAVGSGASNFDGNFWIECPGVTTNNEPHSSFGVWGRLRFPVGGDTLTLLDHTDVTFKVNAKPILPSTLQSRYGSSVSSNTTMGGMTGSTIGVKSEVDNGTGTHYVNGTALLPHFTPSSFSFDESQPMRIGAAGERAILFEVIIDPPGHCCIS